MKHERSRPTLSERQQLIVGFVLVILLAISMLYCLGFASVILRQAWENAPLPWEGTSEGVGTLVVPSTAPLETPGNGTSAP